MIIQKIPYLNAVFYIIPRQAVVSSRKFFTGLINRPVLNGSAVWAAKVPERAQFVQRRKRHFRKVPPSAIFFTFLFCWKRSSSDMKKNICIYIIT